MEAKKYGSMGGLPYIYIYMLTLLRNIVFTQETRGRWIDRGALPYIHICIIYMCIYIYTHTRDFMTSVRYTVYPQSAGEGEDAVATGVPKQSLGDWGCGRSDYFGTSAAR